MKHKHHDVLIAIAEGKEVEYHTEAHNWRVASTDTVNPITFPGLLWRVKPEPEAEWKQKLRQAAREGAHIQWNDNGLWRDSELMTYPDADVFGFAKKSNYRIVPKTVTRWLWAYKDKSNGRWWSAPFPLSEGEAEMRYPAHQLMKMEGTKTELPA